MKERTFALFMLTQHYKVFTEVVKKIMNSIKCQTGPEVRELTLGQVEYVEHTIQHIGAGGICGAHNPVHWGRWNMWSTPSSTLGQVEYMEHTIQCIGAGGICGAHHPAHWGRWNIRSTPSSALGPVEYVEHTIQHIGAGGICGAHHPVHWGGWNEWSTSYSSV